VRVFQNIGLYPAYLPQINRLWQNAETFDDMVKVLINDRFNGVHHLKPVIEFDKNCFFTSGDNAVLQGRWAKEAGLSADTPLQDILLAQIEDHRTEVFYNLDPVRLGNAFLKRLPRCVKKTIAWRAAPSGDALFLDHDLIVNNYPSLAARYREQGAKTAYFFPGHDPVMDAFAANVERPIDVLFIGGYSRHHLERAHSLEAVASLADENNVVFNLDVSRATRLAETPLGWAGPLRKLRRPAVIRHITQSPVFGLEMYKQISRAKTVINGKVDISGPDRGNMRVWETLGCGAALVSDQGLYPSGMNDEKHFFVYTDTENLIANIMELLNDEDARKTRALAGHNMIKTLFSKDEQWKAFQNLC
jgi:Glycosyl transferases group 1